MLQDLRYDPIGKQLKGDAHTTIVGVRRFPGRGSARPPAPRRLNL